MVPNPQNQEWLNLQSLIYIQEFAEAILEQQIVPNFFLLKNMNLCKKHFQFIQFYLDYFIHCVGNLFYSQIVSSVQRLESIQNMFQLMNTREDISTFVQANNPGNYTSPVKSFHKPEESQALVRETTYLMWVCNDILR